MMFVDVSIIFMDLFLMRVNECQKVGIKNNKAHWANLLQDMYLDHGLLHKICLLNLQDDCPDDAAPIFSPRNTWNKLTCRISLKSLKICWWLQQVQTTDASSVSGSRRFHEITKVVNTKLAPRKNDRQQAPEHVANATSWSWAKRSARL